MGPYPPTATRLRPSCYRCGAPLKDPAAPSCTRCSEPRRSVPPAKLLGLVRVRLRLVLLIVACFGAVLGWVVHARRHQLADDSKGFYSHEEMADYQAFLEAVAARHAREAEEKAAAGGADASRWAREAAGARARASAHAERKREYRWRADLKRDGW